MLRLDHLSLPVRDWQKSRDWYRDLLGFEVEFEIPDRQTAAMRDDADLTIFLYQATVADCPGISFTIQVDDVETKLFVRQPFLGQALGAFGRRRFTALQLSSAVGQAFCPPLFHSAAQHRHV